MPGVALPTMSYEGTPMTLGSALQPEAEKYNVGLGTGAGASLQAKSEGNTFMGEGALENNTTGSFNSAFGALALGKNTSGSSNTAGGEGALANITIGVGNSAWGATAGANNKLGNQNTYVGERAGQHHTGNGCIIIGCEAAAAMTTGDEKLLIGRSESAANCLIQGELPNVSLLFNATEMGFFNHALGKQPEVTGATVTAKILAEQLAKIGLVKVN